MGINLPSVYRHTQVTAASTWTIVHNLGGGTAQIPMVDCSIDVNGTIKKINPDEVAIVDENTVTVTWTSAQSGSAVVIV